jgi:hypothetical protein
MKVINLDKFRIETVVELQGVNYTVEGRTVENFLVSDLDERLNACANERDRVRVMVDELETLTTIPREVLLKQHFPVLKALLEILNGNDPESQKSDEAQASGN